MSNNTTNNEFYLSEIKLKAQTKLGNKLF